tara:strand:+ start:778 stop:1311 length:534 start_codon:yes stop_codon:yes gene_type:complete
MKTITEEIFEWSENFVEKKSKKLGGWILCPYARKARLSGKVEVVEVKKANDFLDKLTVAARTFKEQNKDLIVVACSDFELDAYELVCYVEALNHTFVRDDVYLMPFHPYDDSEEVEFLEDNLETENEFFMVLIQLFSKLEEASENLNKQGYYDNWDEEYYKDTVLKRQSYRRIHYGG